MHDAQLALRPAAAQAKNSTPAANGGAKRDARGNRPSVKIARLQAMG